MATKKTNFAKTSETEAAALGQSMAVVLSKNLDDSKLVRRNMPAMIKPDQVAIGEAISGEIIKIVNSPSANIKGKLLWLKHDSGTEFTFPCTGVIRNALAPGVKSDDDKALMEALEKEVGKMFVAKRGPDRASTKYGGKKMFVFDVYTSGK